MDRFREECGILGIYGHPEAAKLAYLGLHALQHRGQEGAGIVSSDGRHLHTEKAMGLVADIFSQERLSRLPGFMAVGHNRYSTAGGSHLKNVQPLVVSYALGPLALAHNGNLPNARLIRDELEAYGAIFQSTIDSEVIVHLTAQSQGATLYDRLVDALVRVRGAYSLLLMNEHEMIAVRDPHGVRPLSLGRLPVGRLPAGQAGTGEGEAHVVASETCALDLIGAEFVRDIEPGEILVISRKGLRSFYPFPRKEPAFCVFEFVYFARPDSLLLGRSVHSIRKAMGRQLARETGIPADLVIPVPDSGVPAALGYAEEAGIPFETGLIRNHYVGRTFIEPQQAIRHFGVKIKLNPVREILEGRRVLVVDDSIVRGTTCKKIVKMIRDAGAREVHVRISSPPTTHPCYYGIDTPTRQELIASSHSVEEIRRYITADTLGYLSLEGMLGEVPGGDQAGFCNACFSGDYPIAFPWEPEQQLGLFEEARAAMEKPVEKPVPAARLDIPEDVGAREAS